MRVDARDVEDGLEVVDRLLRLDHRDDEDLVVRGLLVGAGLAVERRRGSGRWCACPAAGTWQYCTRARASFGVLTIGQITP